MIASMIGVLHMGLSLWDSKEKTKYIDRLMKIKREYRDEINKNRPDNSVLDNLEFELELLGAAFVAKASK